MSSLNIFKPFIYAFLAAIGIALSTACSDNNSMRMRDGSNVEHLNEVFAQLTDSLYRNPQFVLTTIDSLQPAVADSSIYYKLELFKAQILCNIDSSNKGIEVFNNIKGYLHRNEDSNLEMIFWNHYGNYVMFNLGLVDSARNCYERAYKLVAKTDDITRFVSICINYADAYRISGDPALASRYYREALTKLDSIGSKHNIFNIYTGLGQTYADVSNFTEAERYFKLAGTMLDSVSTYDKFFYHNSYGNELYFAHNYEEALVQFQHAAAYATKLRHPSTKNIAETNLCEVNLMLGNITQARFHLDNALELLKQLPYDAMMKFYIYSLAGDIAINEHNPEKARWYFMNAGDTTIITPREKWLHYSRVHQMYAQLNDFHRAYYYLQRANHYKSLFDNSRTRNNIAEIELRYMQDTTIMQQRIVISEKENQVRSLEVRSFIILLITILIISSFISYVTHKRRQNMMKEMKLRQSLYAMRLANIRNRISPHFIFNILNRELKNNNPGINNLVNLLRTNLQLCDQYIVSLSEELNFVDTYIAAEATSLGDNFVYTKSISPDVDVDNIILPSMMIQIFVENAIKHGLRGFDGNKWLKIKVTKGVNETIIIIENQGTPDTRIDANGSTGTGMKVVSQTVNLLNERNQNKIDIDIKHQLSDDRQSATHTVTISIPDNFDFSSIKN